MRLPLPSSSSRCTTHCAVLAWMILAFHPTAVVSWTHVSSFPPAFTTTTTTQLQDAIFYNDFDDDDNAQDKTASEDDAFWYDALRHRQATLDQLQQLQQTQVWKTSPVETLAFPLPDDWVRRVAMDGSTGSSAVVGGASGSLYFMELDATAQQADENPILGKLSNLHQDRGAEDYVDNDAVTRVKDSARNRALDALYGGFDGGGVMALAFQDGVIASSGREGGVQISRINKEPTKNRLELVGSIPDLQGDIVTSLAFDGEGRLWTAFYNQNGGGSIHVYHLDMDVTQKSQPVLNSVDPVSTIKAGSGFLSLFLADDIHCGVAATEDNGVLLFTTDGMMLEGWHPFHEDYQKDNPGGDYYEDEDAEYARTAIIVQNDHRSKEEEVSCWSVIVGGSQGTMYQRKLNLSGDGTTVSFGQPFADAGSRIPEKVARASLSETVKHKGSIVAFASPGPEVLLSASQDGTIRFWDCSYHQLQDDDSDEICKDREGKTLPSFLFALSGFKVWLGSMITLKNNCNMLVTDGADNTVVALIFKPAKDTEQ